MRYLYLLFLLFLALLPAAPAQGQQRASLSGFVRDAATGETLLMANVVLVGTQKGAATNNAGYYSLSAVEPGAYTVAATYLGYEDARLQVTLAPGENGRLDIALQPRSVEVEEVVVSAGRRQDEEARNIGISQMTTAAIKQLPRVFEPDVFRSLQLLPGVKSSSDFSSGLYIRGGGPDQTLILLDRNTVYNPSHFFGFFSSFNPDAIKDVRLFKGGYPSEYGGRLGAVVDIYNKDGNRNQVHGGASVGLLASRAIIEGPYRKGSWMLAARRSTIDPLLSALREGGTESIPDLFYFYDLNGKVNFDAGRNDKFSLAGYSGTDRLDFEFLEDAGVNIALGNRTLSANWTHLFSPRLFSNFTFTSSRYFSDPKFVFSSTKYARTNRIYDNSAKGDLEFAPDGRHALKGGFWAGSFTMDLEDRFDENVTLDKRIQTTYTSAYVQDTYRPSSLLMLQGGLRLNYFSEGDFLRLEPRLSVEYRPLERTRVQLGYGRYYQFLSLISSELFSAFDIWLTTDKGVPPAFGDQYVAGVKNYLGRDINLDAEVYYRTMRDLFELDPFLVDAAGVEYRNIFRYGIGNAYGAEFMLEKTRGRISGFAGYTLGKTQRKFPNINDEQFYAPKYDRTHDLNLVMNYRLARKWRVSSVFTYATGQAYTEPGGQFRMPDYPFATDVPGGVISRYNAARLPAYHRLDLGITKIGRLFGAANYEFQAQVINAYNRRNIWFYLFEFEDDNTVTRNEVPQIPVPIPNVSLTLSF